MLKTKCSPLSKFVPTFPTPYSSDSFLTSRIKSKKLIQKSVCLIIDKRSLDRMTGLEVKPILRCKELNILGKALLFGGNGETCFPLLLIPAESDKRRNLCMKEDTEPCLYIHFSPTRDQVPNHFLSSRKTENFSHFKQIHGHS